MKKVMLFAVLVVGMTSHSIAQDTALPEQSDKGQGIRTVAEGPETGKEKGQLISETASQTGAQKSSETKAKTQGEQEIDNSNINENASHGTDVKAVAGDKTLTGKEKGEAVKAVATSNPKAKRSEHAVRERPSRSERPERASRPERAKRPATTGRPSVPGRQ